MFQTDSVPSVGLPAAGNASQRFAGLLACPACHRLLAHNPDSFECVGCSSRFAIQDGVPLLAIHGTSETWGVPQAREQSSAYQAEYERLERAATYNLEYRRQALKRSSTRREFRLLGRHMDIVGRCDTLLDLPCGGGRLTPAFADRADLVIEADIAIGQILFGRSESVTNTPRLWMTASAFHIPLQDDAVDGTICVRLSHHLPTPSERQRLLEELLRVSRRFVIMTYFDHHSLKNWLRRLRRPFNHKGPKLTMTTAEVADIARSAGARLVSSPPLSRIGSGHRYALIVKDGAAA